MSSIDGFHANDSGRCKAFLNRDPHSFIAANDKDWLGKGMYFWDNCANAVWWRSEKIRKGCVEVWIIKAQIDLANLLDTLDDDIMRILQRLWLEAEKKFQAEGKSVPEALGHRLDILFAVDYSLNSRYTVIRGLTMYPRKPQYSLVMKSRITTQASLIYCVRMENAVINRERVMDHDKA